MTEVSSWRKSSRSGAQADSSCVECRVTWRKGSRSNGGANSNCVEARQRAEGFQVRDSKLGHDSPVFDLQAADFAGLLQSASRA